MMPRLKVVLAMAKVTFREIIRDKILYNILVFALLLMGAGFVASRLSFVRQDRIVLDFGLSAVALTCSMIGIFTGSALMGREIDRRTMHLALARPVSRMQVVFGKYLGLLFVLIVNWFLISLAFLGVLAVSSGNFSDSFNPATYWALVFSLLQSAVVASIAILFSTISTTSLSAILAMGLFLIGQNVSQIRMIATRAHSSTGSFFLNLFSVLLPNLENFSLGTHVTYALPVPAVLAVSAIAYAVFYTLCCLILGGLLIEKREL